MQGLGLEQIGVATGNRGLITVNEKYQTSVPNIYAAGDVTDIPYNQIVIAAGQGVTALLSAVDYLNRNH